MDILSSQDIEPLSYNPRRRQCDSFRPWYGVAVPRRQARMILPPYYRNNFVDASKAFQVSSNEVMQLRLNKPNQDPSTRIFLVPCKHRLSLVSYGGWYRPLHYHTTTPDKNRDMQFRCLHSQ